MLSSDDEEEEKEKEELRALKHTVPAARLTLTRGEKKVKNALAQRDAELRCERIERCKNQETEVEEDERWLGG